MSSAPAIIGIDWGTSSFRAYLLDDEGGLRDKTSSNAGIWNLSDESFESVLLEHCAPWLREHSDLPLIMCGMVGSRNGWREVPYAAPSRGWEEVAGACVDVAVSGCKAKIIPGLVQRSQSGDVDVMRGEETLVFGALEMGLSDEGHCILPGTHSKWVRLRGGRVTGFATYVTGELYSLLSDRSILTSHQESLPTDPAHTGSKDDFLQGIDKAVAGPDLLHQLFLVRSQVLMSERSAQGALEWLSGLLIGTEILSGRRQISAGEPVALIASGELALRYAKALHHLELPFERIDAEAACVGGLFRMAVCAGLVSRPDRARPNEIWREEA